MYYHIYYAYLILSYIIYYITCNTPWIITHIPCMSHIITYILHHIIYHTRYVLFFIPKSAVTAPYMIFLSPNLTLPPPATPGRGRCFPRQPCPCRRRRRLSQEGNIYNAIINVWQVFIFIRDVYDNMQYVRYKIRYKVQ